MRFERLQVARDYAPSPFVRARCGRMPKRSRVAGVDRDEARRERRRREKCRSRPSGLRVPAGALGASVEISIAVGSRRDREEPAHAGLRSRSDGLAFRSPSNSRPRRRYAAGRTAFRARAHRYYAPEVVAGSRFVAADTIVTGELTHFSAYGVVEVYDACGDKACGDSCTLCDPTDGDCIETAVLKYCDADAACRARVPTCDEPTKCGGLAGAACEADEFCSYARGALCGERRLDGQVRAASELVRRRNGRARVRMRWDQLRERVRSEPRGFYVLRDGWCTPPVGCPTRAIRACATSAAATAGSRRASVFLPTSRARRTRRISSGSSQTDPTAVAVASRKFTTRAARKMRGSLASARR